VPAVQRWIVALAVASGLCGIAYELLYARLLTTYLGDMFHVGASILVAFLLGIAAGSFVAHRWARWLWAVEIGIGAYALGFAWLFDRFGRALQETLLPTTAAHPAALVLCVVCLLLIPGMLIGFSVPLFTLLLRSHTHSAGQPEHNAAFSSVYRFYNAGAAACVLAIEFVVLRHLGIRNSLFALASINLIVGFLLCWIQRGARSSASRELVGVDAAPSPVATAAMRTLFAVSALSGIYQMFLYKLAEMIFGPFHENFAVVLALVLLGIVVGTRWADRRPVGFARWLLDGSIAVSVALLASAPIVWLWAAGNGLLGAVPALSTGFKIVAMAALSAVPLAVFGGTIPALLRELPEGREQAGRALGVSSLGNCVGYLLMVLWLYASVPDWLLVACLSGGLLAASAALTWRVGLRPGRRAALAGAALMALAFCWPSHFLHFGYDSYVSLGELRRARANYADVDVHRRFDSQISLLQSANSVETVVINGYRSLVSTRGGHTNLREMLYGLTPALFSKQRDRALVLGVGTGITASVTASLYPRTTGVEVNPSMLALLPRWADHNFSLHENPNVELVLDDGLSALLRSEQRFDAIVNTVTSPLYFSSSKLYTKEFFDLASEHLADGGVYALWFDGRVTEAGARVIFATLAKSFADCAVTYLDTTYLQLLCANEPLQMRNPSSIAWNSQIRAHVDAHGLGLELEEILSALLFPAPRLFESDWNAAHNTFDRPTLEFLMASLGVARQRWWSPYALLDIDVTATPQQSDSITGSNLAVRCYVLRVLQYADVAACLNELTAADDSSASAAADTYANLINTYETSARPLLSENERLDLVRELVSAGALDSAEELLERLEMTPRIRGDFLASLVDLHLVRGESISDVRLAELLTAAPLDPFTRSVIVRALAQRGERSAALAHLQFLRHLGAPTREVRALAQQLGLSPSNAGDDS
jgi:predicted membrane-bound spermidine synthase